MESQKNISISKFNSIPNAFKTVSNKFVSHTALVGSGGKGESFTYGDITTLVNQLSNYLTVNHNENDLIGILSENCPEWTISYFSILSAGKTVLPIDANLTAEEINKIIEHSSVKVIFCSKKFEMILNGYFNLNLISFDKESEKYWREQIARIDETLSPAISDFNEIAVLIYTSGTTGKAKAVQLTHKNLLSNIEAVSEIFQFGTDDTFLSVLPLHHTFEATCGMLTPLFSGSKIVYARSLKSNEILEDIKSNDVSIMCGVPLLYEKIFNSFQKKLKSIPVTKKIMVNTFMSLSRMGWKIGIDAGKLLFKSLREKSGLNSIRIFVSGGAAIPPEISKFFNLIGFKLVQGYGMTECSPVISVNRLDNIRFETVGLPLENIEVSIKNPDSDGIGEIIVRGDSITPGYKDEAELTAELIRDGWLYTGDMGKFTGNHLIITGRNKNLIVSSAGKNIYPEEIEQVLLQSEIIQEALVLGRAHQNKQGEAVWSILVPDLEQLEIIHSIRPVQADDPSLFSVIQNEIKIANQRLASYKRINNFEIRLEELEKTSTKKIKRYLYK